MSRQIKYNTNGNMTRDLNKGIGTTPLNDPLTEGISYNHLNLQTLVKIGTGNIKYIYDAIGVKQQNVAGTTTTDYAGNYAYKKVGLNSATL